MPAGVRGCARPGCPSAAAATLAFDYATRSVWLRPLDSERSPGCYELCTAHADRTRQPHGWSLHDERVLRRLSDADDAAALPHGPPVARGHAQTVAALAAALRDPPGRPVASPERSVAQVATPPARSSGGGSLDHSGGAHALRPPRRPQD
ncbi:MAG TPA: DUF3499 family protein, partial [Nitriliruptorales bacterium]|nr:DUF3499 family protein [Nitriliruptorales bacterium]